MKEIGGGERTLESKNSRENILFRWNYYEGKKNIFKNLSLREYCWRKLYSKGKKNQIRIRKTHIEG